jgi:WD40 repeat protein/predicted Ser/Thr protein kinase
MVFNPGQQLFGGRYIIDSKLGEGGIGITYLAKNKRGELRVIKTLREQILNHPAWLTKQNKLKQDFRDEALRLALCRHPHIVEVENVFDEETLPCMAMEYIEGEDLGKRITQKGALSEAEALLYIQQIGDALTLVHEKGLLHRDLKPSNIMMRARKQAAVLIDFGIARQFIPGGVQQHTQNLTPGYAPPEQYVPDAERGEYIDVYALAATLYALLTGQLPMPAPARLQNFTLKPPQDFDSRISHRVNDAVMKGMALNFRFRPQSVPAWLELLGTTQPTQPPVVIKTHQPGECIRTIPGLSSKFAISPDGEILASAVKNSINLFELRTGQYIRTLSGHSHWVNSVAFSPDGQVIASGSWDNSIKLWQVQTGRKLRTLSGHASSVNSVAFSPDGQVIASGGSDNSIKLWQVQTGRELRTLSGHASSVYSVAFSPDGQVIASGGSDNSIKLWQVQTGRELRTLSGHASSVYSVAFSPDGQVIASGSSDNSIKLWQLQTGRELRTLSGHASSVYSVAFSPDGQVIASGSRDNSIKLWQVQTGRELRTLSGHASSVYSVAFSPDGQVIASGSRDNSIKLWQVQTGRELRTLSGHASSVNSVAFSPDGQVIASGSNDKTIKLWQVQTGRELRTLSGHASSVNSVAFSPDGQFIASGDGDGNIKFWQQG